MSFAHPDEKWSLLIEIKQETPFLHGSSIAFFESSKRKFADDVMECWVGQPLSAAFFPNMMTMWLPKHRKCHHLR